jgi:hypothetical protein
MSRSALGEREQQLLLHVDVRAEPVVHLGEVMIGALHLAVVDHALHVVEQRVDALVIVGEAHEHAE